ncbi:MAG: 3,4-dihydroxy-2-butanone-4-phosphate synthase [Planctomycetota bacterium]
MAGDAEVGLDAVVDRLRAGGMAVVTDDEDRENEGDLFCAAEHATPDAVNFMLREGRGMLFVAVDPAVCDRLDLPPQSAVNTTQRGTAYTVSVDAAARFGLTTGVSASDRSITIRRLADPEARPGDFDRPGHVQPLRARAGGAIVRAGHTEALPDLCRMAGLRPVAAGIEVMRDDGTMARMPDLEAFCAKFDLPRCSVAEVIERRLTGEKLVERVGESDVRTPAGPFHLIAYASRVDPMPHAALVCGGVGALDDHGVPVESNEPVLVRMHSQNLLGDVFGDLDQRSGRGVLEASMRLIQQRGRGAVVYLRHDGMGRGLVQRLQTSGRIGAAAEELGEVPVFGAGLDAHDDPSTAVGPAPRRGAMDYGIGSQVLRDLGVRRIELISKSDFFPGALSGFGLSIERFVDPDTGESRPAQA